MLDKYFLDDYIVRNSIPNRPRAVLVEYLQSEILQSLYSSKFGPMLSFMGGTALRFVYKIDRFSEDLDFEQIQTGLDYDALAIHLAKSLGAVGFAVETRVKKTENIIIIFVKFSDTMNRFGLESMSNEKMKIKFEIDPNPLKSARYESHPLSVYGKSYSVIANTRETIFAQKIIALFYRPYQKGRDFYDLIWFLLQKNVEPNYTLLLEKGLPISNRQELKLALQKKISESDLQMAVKDVERFLFHSEKAQWIIDLQKFIDDF